MFDGKATVLDRDHEISVKGGHELALDAAGRLKARRFNKEKAKSDDLYGWSSLRSAYLAEANESTARIYATNGWYVLRWLGAGWYWSPWFGAYTFIPADGYISSPFGWGLYSPLWVYRAPYGYENYYHTFASFNSNIVHRGSAGPTPALRSGFEDNQLAASGAGIQKRGELHALTPPVRFAVAGGKGGGFHR
ncbi:MAG: hypothetical protein JOZ36_00640 [Acidobacteria bacterium]|nr:hypothetical protein [Acidobacteriota bacterium]